MSSSKEQASSSQVMCFLHEWDQGSKTVRSRMLSDFLAKNTGKTCPELELEFAQVASLFLARLTAWIRLTYPDLWSCFICLCSKKLDTLF